MSPTGDGATGSAVLTVSFADGRDFYAPGDEVAGAARWQLAAPPEALEVRLFWSTRGRGDRDFAVVATDAIERPPAQGEHQFRFRLPPGPYSFSGQLVSLLWAVELVAVDLELAGHAEIVVGPGGCEARIDGGGLAAADVAAASPG